VLYLSINLKEYIVKRKLQIKNKIQIPHAMCEIFNIKAGDEVTIKHSYGDDFLKIYFSKASQKKDP